MRLIARRVLPFHFQNFRAFNHHERKAYFNTAINFFSVVVAGGCGTVVAFSEDARADGLEHHETFLIRLWHQYVYKGSDLKYSDAPWQVALIRQNMPNNVDGLFCGGVLIDKFWVMTAAHCFYSKRGVRLLYPPDLFVGYGSEYLDNVKSNAYVESIYIHPDHEKGQKTGDVLLARSHDIALIRLDQGVEVSGYMRLATPEQVSSMNIPGSTLEVAGWGETYEGKNSPKLKGDKVPVVGYVECKKIQQDFLPSDAICAGSSQRDTCLGDSGGPLFKRGPGSETIQLGIVSYGNGKCGAAPPGVYVSVAAHLEWIARIRAAH